MIVPLCFVWSSGTTSQLPDWSSRRTLPPNLFSMSWNYVFIGNHTLFFYSKRLSISTRIIVVALIICGNGLSYPIDLSRVILKSSLSIVPTLIEILPEGKWAHLHIVFPAPICCLIRPGKCFFFFAITIRFILLCFPSQNMHAYFLYINFIFWHRGPKCFDLILSNIRWKKENVNIFFILRHSDEASEKED